MRIPSSLLKKVLKQAAIEVGKSAGSELKDGIKEAASEKGKEVGRQWTESAVEEAKSIGQNDKYLLPVGDAMELLREDRSNLPDESEIDWTKEQLSQLSDREFVQLALRQEEADVLVDHEIKHVDSVPLDAKKPHTNFLYTVEDLEENKKYDIYVRVTRYNEDITKGTPAIFADSLFNYVKKYDIHPEAIAVFTQESVDKYFELELFAKYGISMGDESIIRRTASLHDIDRSDL
jgi:hypothetical protein